MKYERVGGGGCSYVRIDVCGVLPPLMFFHRGRKKKHCYYFLFKSSHEVKSGGRGRLVILGN